MHQSISLILVLALLALSCAPAEPSAARDDATPARLVDWMTGSFSSAALAAEDDDFREIVLHMVPIWPDRGDGAWLYVEQATAEAADRPYRQRVYRVRHVGEDVYASSVYTIPSPLEHAGAWREQNPLAGISPADLTKREGCTIYLRERADGAFEGSTLGRLCTSELYGATWASSEVVLTEDGLVSWDRGWDDAGNQVWGAEKAGYRFDRIAE